MKETNKNTYWKKRDAKSVTPTKKNSQNDCDSTDGVQCARIIAINSLNDVEVDVYVYHVLNVALQTACICSRWTYKSSETITSFSLLSSSFCESLSCSWLLLSCSNNIKVIKWNHVQYVRTWNTSYDLINLLNRVTLHMLILISFERTCRNALFWLSVSDDLMS